MNKDPYYIFRSDEYIGLGENSVSVGLNFHEEKKDLTKTVSAISFILWWLKIFTMEYLEEFLNITIKALEKERTKSLEGYFMVARVLIMLQNNYFEVVDKKFVKNNFNGTKSINLYPKSEYELCIYENVMNDLHQTILFLAEEYRNNNEEFASAVRVVFGSYIVFVFCQKTGISSWNRLTSKDAYKLAVHFGSVFELISHGSDFINEKQVKELDYEFPKIYIELFGKHKMF
jgi:hypothetical protein